MRCPKCEADLPLESFRLRKDRAGHRTVCRVCEAYYKRNLAPNRRWGRLSHNVRRRMGGDITPQQLKEVLGEPTTCYLCGLPVTWDEQSRLDRPALDHVHPKSRGGAATVDNLRWTHWRCNYVKGALTLPELKELLERLLAQPWANNMHGGVVLKLAQIMNKETVTAKKGPGIGDFDQAPYREIIEAITLGGGAGTLTLDEGDDPTVEKRRLTATAKSMGYVIRWLGVKKGEPTLRPVLEPKAVDEAEAVAKKATRKAKKGEAAAAAVAEVEG